MLEWPFEAVGFRLEEAADLSPPVWTPTTNAVEILGTSNVVTDAPVSGARFYRLHRPWSGG